MTRATKKKTTKRKAKKPAKPKVPEHDGLPIRVEKEEFIDAVPSGRNLFVVSVRTYKGRKALDIRSFYRGDEDWAPGKGAWISADVAGEVLDILSVKRETIDALLD